MSPETFRLIDSLSSWFSAIGTLAAVIVSLFLATRDRKIKLELYAGIGNSFEKLFMHGGPQFEVIVVEIINLRHRPARVIELYFKIGFLRKRIFKITNFHGPETAKVPVKITDGEQVYFEVEQAELIEFTSELQGRIKFPRLWIKFIKIGAITSTKSRFESRIDSSLQDLILKLIKG